MTKFYVHKSSYIDDNVEIGEGTKIWHFCHILSGVKIGKNCVIGQNCMIGSDVSIGDNCKIQNNVSVYKGVTIENDVFIGPSVVFTNVKNPRSFINRRDEFKSTVIRKGATIGANSTIVCGVVIEKYSMIGAGSLITKKVSEHAVITGKDEWSRSICKCGKVFCLPYRDPQCDCMK